MLEDKNIDFEADLFIECDILCEAEEIEEETVTIVPDLSPHLNVYILIEQEVTCRNNLWAQHHYQSSQQQG